MERPEITPRAISAINVPILLIIGDSDIVTPEHAVAMSRFSVVDRGFGVDFCTIRPAGPPHSPDQPAKAPDTAP